MIAATTSTSHAAAHSSSVPQAGQFAIEVNMPDSPQIRRMDDGSSAEFNSFPWLAILERAFEGVALVEPGSWQIVYANPTLLSWLGIPAGSRLTFKLDDVLSTEGTDSLTDQIDAAWRRNEMDEMLCVRLSRVDGVGMQLALRLCHLQLSGAPILALLMQTGGDGAESSPTKSQYLDALTGLPDRSFLLSELRDLMTGERSADRQFAILFVDLDNFKQVNDAHGHLVGDRVLSIVAGRLSDSIRDGDFVVRYGGDEFVLLVKHVATPAEIEPVASRVHLVLAEPISLPEGNFILSASIGAALATPGHHTPEDILAEADRAMYAAKRTSA
jgi:diguanylate cyclase (GGDEF)-like protein